MTDIAAHLKELSQPWGMGDRIKLAIDRAARRAGLSYSRTSDLWYGKARRIEQFEIDQVAAALERKRKEEARNELAELRTRMARLESRLAQIDPDFHRENITALRGQVRGMGGAGCPDDSSMDR